jgi:CRP-like cAMP-binding protein
LFSFASVDELFRFSTITQQVRHAKGSTLQSKGAPAEYIQVLVEGKVAVSETEGTTNEVLPPRMFGFREVLEGRSLTETAVAEETSICVAMEAESFRGLLSDNIELVEGVFRMLMGEPSTSGPPSLLSGAVEVAPNADQPSPGLRPIDKALLLNQLPVFTRSRADELLGLSAMAREIALENESKVFDEGDPSSIWILLSGALSLEPPMEGEPIAAGSGDVLGVDEALVGRTMGWRGRVIAPGKALKIDRQDLMESLAVHPDLLEGIFGALFQTANGEKKGQS